jgi:hypothetical protein
MRSPLEIVATHAVIALQVANDGFDGGAECMAIIWVTVQRLGVQHELPPLGAVTGRGN